MRTKGYMKICKLLPILFMPQYHLLKHMYLSDSMFVALYDYEDPFY